MKKLSAVPRERLFVGQKLRRGGRRAASARAQRRGGSHRDGRWSQVAGARERWGAAPLELRIRSSSSSSSTTTTALPPLPSPPSPLSLLLNSAPLSLSIHPVRLCVCASIRTRCWYHIHPRQTCSDWAQTHQTNHTTTRPSRPDDVPALLYTASSLPFAPTPFTSRHARCDPRRLPSLLDALQSRVVGSHLCCRCNILVGLCITHTASLHSRDLQQGRGRVQRARSSESAHAFYPLDTDSHSYTYYATAK